MSLHAFEFSRLHFGNLLWQRRWTWRPLLDILKVSAVLILQKFASELASMPSVRTLRR
jgi:hypothetical protein